MGGGARFVALFLPLIAGPSIVDAAIVVNELYYDHPSADAGYEFVELLNTGDEAVALDGATLEFHNGSGAGWVVVWRATGSVILAPGRPWVVGGAAVVPPPDVVFEFALQNGPDAIRLLDAQGGVLDVVGYGGLDDPFYVEGRGEPPVDAGQSIARTPDGRDTGDNAADFAPASPTPGRRNVARDDVAAALAATVPVRAGRERAGTESLAIDIVNLGLADVPTGSVLVSAIDSTLSGTRAIAQVHTDAPIPPEGRMRVTLELSLDYLGYHWITIETRYGPDERRVNDRVALVRRVGRPPVLVSEIMSAPREGCPQFVELFNAGTAIVDLAGWRLRDMRSKPARMAADALVLAPKDFLVVAADALVLRACARATERVVGVDGTWPSFNKSGGALADSVVVVDALGIAVDAVAYPGLGTGVVAKSLERIDLFASEVARGAVWRLSRDEGGSPGRPNAGALETQPRAGCEVTPNPFFPDSGDLMRVAVAPTPGVASVVVRIYDPDGRRVREVGSASAFPAVLLWDGRRENGDAVRAGIYVLACEAFGADGTRVGVVKVVVGCANRSP